MGVNQLAFLQPLSYLRGLQLGRPARPGLLPWTNNLQGRAAEMRKPERCPETGSDLSKVTQPASSRDGRRILFPLPPQPCGSSVLCIPNALSLPTLQEPRAPGEGTKVRQTGPSFSATNAQSKNPTSPFLPKPCPVRQPELVPSGPGCG